MSRLSSILNDRLQSGRKSLVAYIVAGDPEPGITVGLMHELVRNGVDVIELGVPFSDPEAEGPVIQLAHERALAHQVSLADCLDMVRAFRTDDRETPIVLMGYLNPIEAMGYRAFTERAAAAGVDGTIIVNLPPEEAGEFTGLMEQADIETVYLLAPTTTNERAEMVCQASRGFVYYVSLKGTTGASTLDLGDVSEKITRFRQYTQLPLMVGFGVKDAETARSVAAIADGAVVGSAIVSLMEKHREDPQILNREVGRFVAGLRSALG